MDKKRKLPARASRESANKKRITTPPEAQTAPPPAPAEAPSHTYHDTLPKRVLPGEPLPTVDTPQSDLSDRNYQTISESGVLADSLQRSRAKWLSEGIFERYWIKPSVKAKKTLAATELANNPSKESMTKLGTCQIHVEPHIFEAQMFGIKDPTSKPANPPASSQQPMFRPIVQYGPPNGVMPPPPPKPVPIPKPVPQASPKDTHMKHASSPSPSVSSQNANGTGHNGQASSSTPQPNKSTDPVIQMLAERAATDADLKALMRIVANGEATPEQLKKFQTHIDELTRLQKSRQAASQPPTPVQSRPSPAPSAPGTPVQTNGTPSVRPSPSPAPSPAPAAKPVAATPPPQPQYQAQPQALRSKGPVPAKSEYSGVVFEFTGGNGDRYLFPKFSILDYRNQGEVIASFLIVRKGSASDSPTYDPELDYYQPMTIRLYANQGRQLDTLQKVVAPADEVRRYMDDIMDNTTRAEYVLLAMRLPRDAEEEVEKNDSPRPGQTDTQVLWATTHPAPAVQPVKPAKAIPTESEQYQTFIQSVSEKVGV